MSDSKFCEQCGKPLREGTRFCESCGAPVAAASQAAEPIQKAPEAAAPAASRRGRSKAATFFLAASAAAVIGGGIWWGLRHWAGARAAGRTEWIAISIEEVEAALGESVDIPGGGLFRVRHPSKNLVAIAGGISAGDDEFQDAFDNRDVRQESVRRGILEEVEKGAREEFGSDGAASGDFEVSFENIGEQSVFLCRFGKSPYQYRIFGLSPAGARVMAMSSDEKMDWDAAEIVELRYMAGLDGAKDLPAAVVVPVPTPSPAVSLGFGDFEGGAPAGLTGDGGRDSVDGNGVWRLQGPDEMNISLPLSSGASGVDIAVSCRVLVPTTTRTDAQLGGVRIRLRFTDRFSSSAVADVVLRASDSWQRVEQGFEDTGSGPYTLGMEVYGHDGPVYVDDLDVTARSAEAPGRAELEDWVAAQAWFRKLTASMPSGVTLSVTRGAADEPGWEAFEVREHHSPASGFDPDVSPLVGLFQVSPNRDGTAWMNPVTGEWQPVEDFLPSRGLEQ